MKTISKLVGQATAASTGLLHADPSLSGVLLPAASGPGVSGSGVSGGGTRSGCAWSLASRRSESGVFVPSGIDLRRPATAPARDWAVTDADRRDVRSIERDIRPTQAPEAAVTGGAYADGAADHQQNDQQIVRAEAVFAGAKAVTMRGLRGLHPWREQT